MQFLCLASDCDDIIEHIWAYDAESESFVFFFIFAPSGVLGCSLVLSVHGMYSPSDDVIELTPSNFNREVIQSDSLWLVEFYAPWWVHTSTVAVIQWEQVS